jgi:hypothetical protein
VTIKVGRAIKGFIMFAQIFMLVIAIGLMVIGFSDGRLFDIALGALLAVGTLMRLYALYSGKDNALWTKVASLFSKQKSVS